MTGFQACMKVSLILQPSSQMLKQCWQQGIHYLIPEAPGCICYSLHYFFLTVQSTQNNHLKFLISSKNAERKYKICSFQNDWSKLKDNFSRVSIALIDFKRPPISFFAIQSLSKSSTASLF